MRKATHIGECQLCGRVQKLPGDLLAKHGYTTQWGFFSGVCGGADSRPLEVSCDLIEAARVRVEAARVQLIEQAVALEAVEGTRGFYSQYVPAKWGQGGRRVPSSHKWVEVEFREVTRPSGTETYTSVEFDVDGKTESAYRHNIEGRTAVACAKNANAKRANAWRREATKFGEYAAWLSERLASWKPRALRPIKVAAKAAADVAVQS